MVLLMLAQAHKGEEWLCKRGLCKQAKDSTTPCLSLLGGQMGKEGFCLREPNLEAFPNLRLGQILGVEGDLE